MLWIFLAESRVVKFGEGRKQKVKHFIYCSKSRRRGRAKGEFIRG